MISLWTQYKNESTLITFLYFTYVHKSCIKLYNACCSQEIIPQNKNKNMDGRSNTLRPRQNGRHFPDHIFKWIFLNENVWISIKISLKFVPKGPINNILALVQIMAWRRPGDKPLIEPMMIVLQTHICVTRPQWFNDLAICPQLQDIFKLLASDGPLTQSDGKNYCLS